MKTHKLIALLGLTCLSASLVGCTQPNPLAGQSVFNPVTGQTNIQPAVIVDTNKIQQIDQQLKGALDKASQLNSATAAFNPYAPQVQVGIDAAKAVEVGVPTAIAIISSIVAWFQNRGKKIQTAAAAQLAKSPTNEHAIANASPTVAAAIAVHAADAQEVSPKTS